jgi:ketosteroid isomerase-like protein
MLRRGYELWNEGDFDALADLFDPEVQLDASRRVLNPAHYHGIEGFRKMTAELFDVWDEWSIEPTRFLWNGDRVLIETRIDARGKGSGVRVAETYYTVWTLANGRGTAMEIHVDADEAYRSAGLPGPRDT